MDISWAVNSNGTPVNLSSIQYVRVYTGTAQMNGMFGEISTEALGVAAATGTGGSVPTTDLVVKKGAKTVSTNNMGYQEVDTGSYKITSNEENVYVNGIKVTATSGYTFTVSTGVTYQILTQNNTESPYITVLKGK